MKTVVLDPPPIEVQQLIERRKQLGLDLYDEVWEGTYHMTPAPRARHGYLLDELVRVLRPFMEPAGLVGTAPFNLGDADDYRVPDYGYHRGMPDLEAIYLSTAAVVVEVVSPGDETYDKLPFYASHKVDEVIIVVPAQERVELLALVRDHYEAADRSAVLGVGASDLAAAVRWI
jgi:Uma2 family endonuclease